MTRATTINQSLLVINQSFMELSLKIMLYFNYLSTIQIIYSRVLF